MSLETVIFMIMKQLDRQRTVSAPYHILKGKKSGQTIQDIGYFNLHPFFSVSPKLVKEVYDQAVVSLRQQGFLESENGVIRLTPNALSREFPVHHLNGWKYRGQERLFFARLSLIIQSLSHVHQCIRVFDPVQPSDHLQRWVKHYLQTIGYRDQAVYQAFKEETAGSLEAAPVADLHKWVLMQRLSGYQVSGKTWSQLAAETGGTEEDVKLTAVEALHAWMTVIEQGGYPLLEGLLAGIAGQSSLTDSAQKTIQLFRAGHSLEEIAKIRRLKTSTIEDHFVELAMNDPSFDVRLFMDPEDYRKVVEISRSHRTMRLRDIKNELPELSYFQIRLALSAKGGQS